MVKFEKYLVGRALLDVGCGDGMWISQCFAQKFFYVVGIDVVKNKSWSKVRSSNVDFIVCEAGHLPFVGMAFDTCFLKDVLHHADAPSFILEEVKRCTRGTVIVIEANRHDPIGFIHMVKFRGHDHFVWGDFVRMMMQVYSSCQRMFFCHARSHYVPIPSALLIRFVGLVMGLLERSRLPPSHNIGVVEVFDTGALTRNVR